MATGRSYTPSQPVTMRDARPSDLPRVESLLRAARLPTQGVAEHLDQFEVAEVDGRLVGTAGVEVYGGAGLLRSVAVDPAYRNRGLARELVRRLLDRAAGAGVADVYLLTTTASDYFQRLGFERITREKVRPEVRASEEFGDTLCATAQAMRKVLTLR